MSMRTRQWRPGLALGPSVLLLVILRDRAPKVGKYVGEIGPSVVGEYVGGHATKRQHEIRVHRPPMLATRR